MTELDKYYEEASRKLADDIDFQVMGQLMVDSGWTKIVRSRGRQETPAMLESIARWVTKNCQGQSLTRGSTWYFELDEDAVLFTLRWL